MAKCPVMTPELITALLELAIRLITAGLAGEAGPILTVEDMAPASPDALDAVADAAEGKPIEITVNMVVSEEELAKIKAITDEEPQA